MNSMQNPNVLHITAQPGFVLLAAQALEDRDHGGFSGVQKGSLSKFGGDFQKFLGFRHINSHVYQGSTR